MNANDAIVELTQAVHDLCREVASVHDGVPLEAIVPVIAPGGRAPNRLGYLDTDRWLVGDSVPAHEMALIADHLDRGTEQVATTIIHELVHAFAHSADIKDTSRQGRYHNARFAELAREFALEVDHGGEPHGWTTIGLTDVARQRYTEELGRLDRALVLVRLARRCRVPNPGSRRPKRRAWVSAKCECDRQIRLSAADFERGRIQCSNCRRFFNQAR